MATFIALMNYTEQGVRSIKESPKRAEAFKGMAAQRDVTVKDIYWTAGGYDLVAILEGTDEAVASALLSVSALGNVRSQTLRAFSSAEMARIVANMA